MLRLITRLAVILLLIGAAAAAAADSPPPAYFWPPATDVAIFKAGCAYIIREGETSIAPGGILTERVPRPVLGTLDVYSLTEGVKVGEVVAFYDEFEREAPITDLDAFYRRQIGRRVELEYDKGAVEGVLRAVLSPGHLLVETGADTVLIPIAAVTRLTFVGAPALAGTEQGRQARFRIKLLGNARRARLGLSYLEESWAWFPTYRLNLRPGGQAELVLAATVVNNAEDVQGATLHLIVGVPNFMMRGTLSPMALDVETGVLAAAPRLDNALRSQVMAKGYAAAEAAYDGDAAGGAVPVGDVEDLFVYEKKAFTLGKGQRMQLELFRSLIPCESLYKWDVPLPDTGRYNQSQFQNQGALRGEQAGEVWHYFRLTNRTNVPWTTAPAMIVSAWQPVAQDLMKYVSVGGSHDLRVTVATDLRGRAAEEEIERKTVRLFKNDDYLQITVRGTLTLENFKKEPARVEIRKNLWGAVRDGGGGAVTKTTEYLWNVNPRSRIDWQVDLPAKGKKTLTYTYELYVNI
ncbi:MAG: hypothetical protein ACM3X6_06545 [Patescibacteria group bacterium]